MQTTKLSIIAVGLLTGLLACTPTADSEKVEPPTASKQTLPTSAVPTESAQTQKETRLTDSKAPEPTSDTALIPDNPDAETPVQDATLSASSKNDLCDGSVTQQEMNICAQESYKQADAELNRTYQTLISDLTPSGQQALSSAELAWIEFRDRNCTFAQNQFIGGSIAPLIYSSCLESHTEMRIAELQQPPLPQVSYQAADAELNSTYQELLAVLSAPETEDMTDIQLAWIEYRDRNCAFENLYSANAIEESQCLARMSETRTAQLKQDIDQRSL